VGSVLRPAIQYTIDVRHAISSELDSLLDLTQRLIRAALGYEVDKLFASARNTPAQGRGACATNLLIPGTGRVQLRNRPAGAGDAPADGYHYFSSATCTVSEPSTVRILARSAWPLFAASTEPSTLART